MKKLEDFADDINKCSKCGLCQSVCPVYKITGNDCAVSRGKFVMLDGVLKGDLKLNKNIEKYLDMCLKCGKCKDFCPSNIDVCEIFNTAKYEYAKNTMLGRFEKFLESRLVFGNFINIMKTTAPRKKFTKKGKQKLLYFKGCVNEVFPKVENALKIVFEHLDVEIIERDFECCGLPFLSSGNMERFEEVKKRNLELMDCEYDYILTDCASCEHTLNGYFANPSPEFLNSQASLKNSTLSRKGRGNIINAAEFLSSQNVKFKFKNHVKVTFHKPCHLENEDFLQALLEKCENVEYVEMKDYDECCGFAGEFAVKNPKISQKLSKQKAENAINTGAEYLLTTCPACVMGLHQGFIAAGKKAPKIMNTMEFLAKADIISQE